MQRYRTNSAILSELNASMAPQWSSALCADRRQNTAARQVADHSVTILELLVIHLFKVCAVAVPLSLFSRSHADTLASLAVLKLSFARCRFVPNNVHCKIACGRMHADTIFSAILNSYCKDHGAPLAWMQGDPQTRHGSIVELDSQTHHPKTQCISPCI